MLWRSTPAFKIEISGETFINDEALTVVVKRVENNLSYIVLQVEDYQSANYVDVFDTFDSISLSLRYGADSWSKVLTGDVTTSKPHLSGEGEVLEVGAWGEGIALLKTHCDESYGVESIDNSTVDTPKEILDDLISEHINKEYGGVASGYAIISEVDNIHAGLSVTYLNSQYLNNFVNLNRVCDLANAYAGGLSDVSIHWFVDPDKNLMVKEIDQDHSSGDWDRYYGGSQANATIEVAKDMILYDFSKNVEEYANSIVLSSQFRKPSEDYWTEDTGGATLWGTTDATVTDSATHIVGSHSLLIEPTGAAAFYAYYPSTQDAAWNLTACGSQNTIPAINFWCRRNKTLGANTTIRLCTNAGARYEPFGGFDQHIGVDNDWVFLSFPLGPYHYSQQTQLAKRWVVGAGAPSWSNINYIEFQVQGADVTKDLYIDDLHFSGVIVREARDTSEITANGLYQKVIRNDTAVNDTLKASDDSGTAAQLCYAELLRRSQTPLVGMIQIPMLPDLLPGQTLHIHACKKTDGTFRIDKDVRVKDLRHIINKDKGFTTILNITNDVTNSHAFGVPSSYSLMKQYAGALGHSEARNLKGGALDNLIPRLSVNY